jgi:Flp pilus assembly protein TadB
MDPTQPAAEPPIWNPRALLKREWPYLLVLALALFGIAYTSFSRSPMGVYWMVLAPLIGVLCVVSGWTEARERDEHIRLLLTQALHWLAVVLAMDLMFLTDVVRMMNADASALAVLTLLALGTFTAGVHIGSWRMALVGVILGLGVPGIAWLEQSALLILLAIVIIGALLAPLLWRGRRDHRSDADDRGAPPSTPSIGAI